MANQSKLHRSGRAKQLELLFERLLWKFRLVAMLPVVMSLVSTGVTFVLGTKSIVRSLIALQAPEGIGDKA